MYKIIIQAKGYIFKLKNNNNYNIKKEKGFHIIKCIIIKLTE